MPKLKTTLRLLLLLTGFLLAACGADTAAPQDTAADDTSSSEDAQASVTQPTPVSFDGQAVIYVAAPLSGPNAGEGQAQAAGARLAADILNEQGGVLGREIVIEVVNDRGSPDGAEAAAEQVIAAVDDQTILGVVASETSDPQYQAVQNVYLSDDSLLDSLVVVPASTSPLEIGRAHV